jgi:hypothetical protein
MSILVDYLFSDAFTRSKGAIDMPSAYIEGYAYLQSKFYGHEAGDFYDDKNVYPWMPPSLLSTQSEQFNYVTFRGNNAVYIALLNQSDKTIVSKIKLNPEFFSGISRRGYKANVWIDNVPVTAGRRFVNGEFEVRVNPQGITAIKIPGLKPSIDFQNQVYGDKGAASPGLFSLAEVNGKAMVLDFGSGLKTFYAYLRDDDQKISEARLTYTIGGKESSITDNLYPYEFTVSLPDQSDSAEFLIRAVDKKGTVREDRITLKTD